MSQFLLLLYQKLTPKHFYIPKERTSINHYHIHSFFLTLIFFFVTTDSLSAINYLDLVVNWLSKGHEPNILLNMTLQQYNEMK
jgi:5,10-methenyltetrahydromethanopterin hydrogenase